MDFSNIFVIIFIIGTVFSFSLNMLLERLDFTFRKKHGREIPEILSQHVDFQTLDKTCLYEDAKYRLWIPSSILETILSLYLVFCGFYPALIERIWTWTDNPFFAALLFLVLGGIPGALLSIPFALYSEFGIEKHFGFSNMTIRMWIADEIKGFFVNLLILTPLLLAMIALFKYTAGWWWLLLGCVYLVFSLGISIIYPIFIAPIFNKFTPLEDGELKSRLEELLKKCGFKASGLFVMDASRRSGHSNAYFTGFGKSKRVVLYDTLIEQLTIDEIEAVLGHELGHYKHHHILKKMLFMIPAVFASLFVISLLVNLPLLYKGFGFVSGEVVPYQMMFIGIFLLSLVFGDWGILLSPIMNSLSRHDEFQADAFAKEICGTGEPLCTALVKLNKENLSEIQVPKIYSVFNYSHPPLLERIKALRA
ncbi:M48 family metallopeptidase [Treponema sp.]|uniref:M48 family metallopeptidase n=1 Tax=Treponema sp. TaxID=166 RepID=UPI0025E660B8|nr:M48 family metallopeptidase [Treponema sp.]MBR4323076.1 M48 family metallopeptidase [Treponema sp.]